jgi:hypothetical protein
VSLVQRVLLAAVGVASLALPAVRAWADDGVELGRIFLTPTERRLLDQRRMHPAQSTDGLPRNLLPGRPQPAQRLVMNGLVRRGREAPVVWLNGERAGAAANVRIAGVPDRRQSVPVESDGNGTRRLKPGQAWDLQTGRVSECMPCSPPVPAAQATPQATPQATAQATP